MTDKELRKLSRLELLELLLEASKENQQLKEEISRLELENKTSQNIETLSAMTRQVEASLKYASSLTGALQGSSDTEFPQRPVKACPAPHRTEKSTTDAGIYKRLLIFFAANEEKLDALPCDIRDDIKKRLGELIKRKTD